MWEPLACRSAQTLACRGLRVGPSKGAGDFGTGTGRKAFPPVHMLLRRKKGKFIGAGNFFPIAWPF